MRGIGAYRPRQDAWSVRQRGQEMCDQPSDAHVLLQTLQDSVHSHFFFLTEGQRNRLHCNVVANDATL